MIKQDLPEFGHILAILSEIYDHTISEGVTEWYFELLNEYSISEIQYAAKQILRTNTFHKFPLPAAFIQELNIEKLNQYDQYVLPESTRNMLRDMRKSEQKRIVDLRETIGKRPRPRIAAIPR